MQFSLKMPKLTEEQEAQLHALENLPADQIDTSDVPERPINRSKPVRGAFYQPMKQEITLNLDDYIIEWFKTNATGAQDCPESINQALLEHIRLQHFPTQTKASKIAAQG